MLISEASESFLLILHNIAFELNRSLELEILLLLEHSPTWNIQFLAYHLLISNKSGPKKSHRKLGKKMGRYVVRSICLLLNIHGSKIGDLSFESH